MLSSLFLVGGSFRANDPKANPMSVLTVTSGSAGTPIV